MARGLGKLLLAAGAAVWISRPNSNTRECFTAGCTQRSPMMGRSLRGRAPADRVVMYAVADEEPLFQEGQQVTVIGPPQMAGKKGSIIGPASGDAWAVRFESGSVFNIDTENIQGSGMPAPAAAAPAAAPAAPVARVTLPAGDDEEPLFQEGQQITLLNPPLMAGKKGTIIGEVAGGEFWAVRLESGSVFNIAVENIQGSGAAPAAATQAAPAARVTLPAGDEEEPLFHEGQQIVVLGPPMMAGKKGSIIGPVAGDAWAVRFESGSVFNIDTVNIQGGGGGAAPVAAAPAPAVSRVTAAAADDEELEFEEGQLVVVNGPPQMAGKRGTIIKPVSGGEAWSIKFESGSVFNIETAHIQR